MLHAGRVILLLMTIMPGRAALGESNTDSEIWALHRDGEFLISAMSGEELGTAEGIHVAVTSLTVHGHYFAQDEERQKTLRKAIELSRMLVAMRPEDPDAHFHLARALGRYAQTLPPLKALSEGIGDKIKQSLNRALQLDADFWPAHLAFGTWHVEIVAKGGLLGKLTFGASENQAKHHLARAAELAPDSAVMHLETALAYRLLGAKEHRVRIFRHLLLAIEKPVHDAYDEIVQATAASLLNES